MSWRVQIETGLQKSSWETGPTPWPSRSPMPIYKEQRNPLPRASDEPLGVGPRPCRAQRTQGRPERGPQSDWAQLVSGVHARRCTQCATRGPSRRSRLTAEVALLSRSGILHTTWPFAALQVAPQPRTANHLPSCVGRHIMNFRETPRQARGPTVCLRRPLNILEKREHQSVR